MTVDENESNMDILFKINWGNIECYNLYNNVLLNQLLW